MRNKNRIAGSFAAIAMSSLLIACSASTDDSQAGPGGPGGPGGGPGNGETVDLKISDTIEVEAADEKAKAIVDAAEAFIATLDSDQKKTALYEFGDNEQRARWSNFPTSFVERGGIMRKDLNDTQKAALEKLLSEILSADGLRNAKLQMAADDVLASEGGGNGPDADFGSGFYYVAILGEPSVDQPWMVQFGGHHLALNVTLVGPKASFSPMLTGGQPLTVQFEGKEVYITRQEVEASRALLASLDADQKKQAIRGDEVINILLGPGEYGTTIAAEGISGADMTDAQKALLVKVIEARIGQLNERDAAAKMEEVKADLDKTYFGWWGPTDKFGAAYVRISGPSIMMEYGPQSLGGDNSEHAHDMYRDPTNDYGSAWVSAK